MKLLGYSKIYSCMIFFSMSSSSLFLYSMDKEKAATPAALEAGIAQIKLDGEKKTDSGIELALVSPKIRRTFDLKQYYDEETKTLDLSRFPLADGDQALKLLYFGKEEVVAGESASGPLLHFLESVPVENLILERMNLNEIPIYIILYALASNTLKYLSLQYNRFKLPGISASHPRAASEAFTLDQLASEGSSAPEKAAPRGDRNSLAVVQLPAGRVRTSGLAVAAAEFTSSFLQDLLPMAEQAIQAQNVQGDARVQVFKKIIKIHEKLPPITIVDRCVLSKVQPQSSKREKAVAICIKVAISVGSMIIGFLPYLISYLATEDECSC